MAKGEALGTEDRKKVEEMIREFRKKDKYSDEDVAKEALKRHHIDIATSGVVRIRKNMGIMLKDHGQQGTTRARNLETPQGILAAASDKLAAAATTFREAFELLEALEKTMDSLPKISQRDLDAIRVLIPSLLPRAGVGPAVTSKIGSAMQGQPAAPAQ